ncbi:hypothetical protein [Alienimonas sp. DA493]|uniref:hypothetical protein n=1 Tax=Alienimonas sp. DA493 TaxID=3373605 RepID=UPI003754B0AF
MAPTPTNRLAAAALLLSGLCTGCGGSGGAAGGGPDAEDLRAQMKANDVGADRPVDDRNARWWTGQLEAFVRYRTIDNQEKAERGDEFDRLEVEKSLGDWKADLAGRRFSLTDVVPHAVKVLDDRGSSIALGMELPLKLFRADGDGVGGGAFDRLALQSVGPQRGFLTKDDRVQFVDPWQVEQVRQLDGIVYALEAETSYLAVSLEGDPEAMKAIFRNAGDCRAEIVVEDLRYAPQKAQGWFKIPPDSERDPLQDLNAVKEAELTRMGVGGAPRAAPDYFMTRWEPFGEGMPSRVEGRLRALTVRNADGVEIASWISRPKPSGPEE